MIREKKKSIVLHSIGREQTYIYIYSDSKVQRKEKKTKNKNSSSLQHCPKKKKEETSNQYFFFHCCSKITSLYSYLFPSHTRTLFLYFFKSTHNPPPLRPSPDTRYHHHSSKQKNIENRGSPSEPHRKEGRYENLRLTARTKAHTRRFSPFTPRRKEKQ